MYFTLADMAIWIDELEMKVEKKHLPLACFSFRHLGKKHVPDPEPESHYETGDEVCIIWLKFREIP